MDLFTPIILIAFALVLLAFYVVANKREWFKPLGKSFKKPYGPLHIHFFFLLVIPACLIAGIVLLFV